MGETQLMEIFLIFKDSNMLRVIATHLYYNKQQIQAIQNQKVQELSKFVWKEEVS